jgi:hypothetical protein
MMLRMSIGGTFSDEMPGGHEPEGESARATLRRLFRWIAARLTKLRLHT